MKKMVAVLSVCCLMQAGLVQAQGYVGGKLGATWLDDSCLGGESCDDDSFGGGIYTGYEFSKHIAVELGYDYLGKFTGGGLDDKTVTAVTVAPKFNFPLAEDFSAYIKTGLGFVNFGDGDDASFLGALGGEYMIQPNLGLRLEYQILTDMSNDLVRAQGNMVTLGLSYKFGQGKKYHKPMGAKPAPKPHKVMAAPVPAPEPVRQEKPSEPKVFKKSLSGTNTFATNSAELTATESLQEVVDILSRYPQAKVMITGYTDSRGPEAYNQQLSERRAKSVSQFLISKGIEAERVSAKGMGEANPVASNETKAGREKNRRVEIEIPVFEYQ
ncbi:OmpA family protein [Vibrio quintilis]|uniref:Outer membrane protein A n=1 Tax=Vibrio quintilis TaxID=1117707 RepID=A0A1M7Z289_9VIBR|nr:OmpA family protein [Vibrio quintilis]SHO58944.1 Outer membrane protein A precursor [Vibrio quintilis]